MNRTALAILVLLPCLACESPLAPLPNGAPERFEFSIGGFGVGSAQWILSGDTILTIKTRWAEPGFGPDTVRYRPTADDWVRFWSAADDAGIRRWQQRYVAEGIIDGQGWSLRVGAGKLRIESEGSNAYPDDSGREHELEMPPDFQLFITAVRALAGESTFWIRPGAFLR